jgi:hypothetical protein
MWYYLFLFGKYFLGTVGGGIFLLPLIFGKSPKLDYF